PEGALPLAPWLGAPGAIDGMRALGRSEGRRGAAARAPLRGPPPHGVGEPVLRAMGIVVADDDPAVTWFLSGVLRAAGATVHEGHDGGGGLDLACLTPTDTAASEL